MAYISFVMEQKGDPENREKGVQNMENPITVFAILIVALSLAAFIAAASY